MAGAGGGGAGQAWGGQGSKPRAVVRPYDEGREEKAPFPAPATVWEQGAPRGPTGVGAPQPRGERGARGRARGAVSVGKGRGRGAEQLGVTLLRREVQGEAGRGGGGGQGGEKEKGCGGNFETMWAAMAANTAPASVPAPGASVEDMEKSLKAMLNIGGREGAAKGQGVEGSATGQGAKGSQGAALQEVMARQSFCSELAVLLAARGRQGARYDTLASQGGLIAQVSLDDGSIFLSPVPLPDTDAASELAAKLALESLRGLEPALAPPPLAQGVQELQAQARGARGARGRGRKGAKEREEVANVFQPWAEVVEGEVVAAAPAKPKVVRSKQERSMAGTKAMDIRYRDQVEQVEEGEEGEEGKLQKQLQEQEAKPPIFGVPLQVGLRVLCSPYHSPSSGHMMCLGVMVQW